jgi:hypothetical protein
MPAYNISLGVLGVTQMDDDGPYSDFGLAYPLCARINCIEIDARHGFG